MTTLAVLQWVSTLAGLGLILFAGVSLWRSSHRLTALESGLTPNLTEEKVSGYKRWFKRQGLHPRNLRNGASVVNNYPSSISPSDDNDNSGAEVTEEFIATIKATDALDWTRMYNVIQHGPSKLCLSLNGGHVNAASINDGGVPPGMVEDWLHLKRNDDLSIEVTRINTALLSHMTKRVAGLSGKRTGLHETMLAIQDGTVDGVRDRSLRGDWQGVAVLLQAAARKTLEDNP